MLVLLNSEASTHCVYLALHIFLFQLTQDQYVFIHDALCDYITCGDTSVLAYELRTALHSLQKVDDMGQSGFRRQFEVCARSD